MTGMRDLRRPKPAENSTQPSIEAGDERRIRCYVIRLRRGNMVLLFPHDGAWRPISRLFVTLVQRTLRP